MRRRLLRRPGLPALAATLAAAAMALGALLWFRPYLTRNQMFPSSVAAPAALTATSPFSVPAGQRACMSSVTAEPSSESAQFQVIEAAGPGSRGGPPLELLLEGAGYRSASRLPGGYRGGIVTMAVTPPEHPLMVSACFVNRGRRPVILAGSVEARTIARSGTTIAGVSVVGTISLTFLEGRSSSLLERLGTTFEHASNLTDRLVPVWLVWVLAVLVAFGVPCGICAAFYRALREDAATGRI